MPGIEETFKRDVSHEVHWEAFRLGLSKKDGFKPPQLLRWRDWSWEKHLGMTEVWQIDHANNEEESLTMGDDKIQNTWHGPFVLFTAYKGVRALPGPERQHSSTNK